MPYLWPTLIALLALILLVAGFFVFRFLSYLGTREAGFQAQQKGKPAETEQHFLTALQKADRFGLRRWVLPISLFDLASFGEVYAGGSVVTATAPLSSLPLYLKRGQAIPTTDTSASHTTHARWEQLSWLAHAGPEGLTGSLYEQKFPGGLRRCAEQWS